MSNASACQVLDQLPQEVGIFEHGVKDVLGKQISNVLSQINQLTQKRAMHFSRSPTSSFHKTQ
jgi:hypothetical protein